MTDYKNTLNLPKTDFAMKANLPAREPEILAFWQEIALYEQLRRAGKNRPVFILHDGPPYANGNIHIGHAINKALKDFIIKSKTLSNYDAPYVPGWDCHGLPIELNVEKNKSTSKEMMPIEFITACRHYAQSQVDLQCADFKRLGVVADWTHPYLTMDSHYEANTIRSLARIIANGHLQQGHKPVQWCTECGSALAEAEVEYKDKVSDAIDVLFRVVNAQEVLTRLNVSLGEVEIALPIWTTTPWTLPANQAVAVNPTHDYVLIEVTGRRPQFLILAAALLDSFLQRVNRTDYTVYATCLGNALEGIRLHHPFLKREVPIALGDHVTLDAGTGAVHTAPAHGLEDYSVGQKYALPMDNPVDASGVFLPGTPFVAGEHVFKANPLIIALLQENVNLLHAEKIVHSYAHCWRHKTPLIYRATPQWFISMEKNGLREQALAAINETHWLPDWGRTRITDMVEKRPDWCISRQRIWNTPLALIVNKHTGELHADTLGIMEKVASLVAQHGIEIWQQLRVCDLITKDFDDYEKVADTLDVWFDSGTSHAYVLVSHCDDSPADLYLEGSDQHRGWFQTSLLSCVAMHGRAPYKTVLTHGFAVDAQGRKMSKSLGNVVAPEKVINRLGADVLRLWIATADYRGEMSVSDEILERCSENYRRIRNTVRFFLSNLNDFDPATQCVPADSMLQLDQWAVDAAAQTQEEIIAAYDTYQFHQASQRIHYFCTTAMGGFYLDIVKDRLYTTQPNSLARRSAQTALYHILQAVVRWIAPILSFTAEEIWQHVPGRQEQSIFLTTWYQELARITPALCQDWQQVIALRERVNQELEQSRNAGLIGSSLAAKVDLYCDGALFEVLSGFGEELRFILITSAAQVHPCDDHTSGRMIKVSAVEFAKCQRCWHRCQEVGTHAVHRLLCKRCIQNIAGEGETRRFA